MRCGIIALLTALAIVSGVKAQITVDGSLDSAYGAPVATQTINSGFGDSAVGDGSSANGSELDAAYDAYSPGYLYLFFAGNFESNGKHIDIFLSGGQSGQSTLAAPKTASLQGMNGSIFSPGFEATYAIDLNDYNSMVNVEEYSLSGRASGGYVGSFPLTGGIGSGSPGGAIVYGWNDTNAAGINGNSGTAASVAAANAVTTGLEIRIPLTLLGDPILPLMALADVSGGGDAYLSNQFLPGLPAGTANVGDGGSFTGPGASIFNFSSTPDEFFMVPEPASAGLLGGIALILTARRRSKIYPSVRRELIH